MVEWFEFETDDDAPSEKLVKAVRRHTPEDVLLIASYHDQRRTSKMKGSQQNGVSEPTHLSGQRRGSRTLCRDVPEARIETSRKRHSLQPRASSTTQGAASRWSSDRSFLTNLQKQLKEEAATWEDEITYEVSI